MRRTPRVAGQFYSSDADTLSKEVGNLLSAGAASEKEEVLAMIAPHAGYIYSGAVAGAVYSAVKIPDDIILIGPNHTGLGAASALMAYGEWSVPNGKLAINEVIAERLLASSDLFTKDVTAHMGEHSLEVQLPFIYALNPDARIVPITVMRHGYADCAAMGRAIAAVIKEYGKEVLIAVSSDMNHYESDKVSRIKDRLAIDKILALDPEGLLAVTRDEEISMCGVVPSTIALTAAIELGASEARLIDYDTSATASGDYSHVVGYAGLLVK